MQALHGCKDLHISEVGPGNQQQDSCGCPDGGGPGNAVKDRRMGADAAGSGVHRLEALLPSGRVLPFNGESGSDAA